MKKSLLMLFVVLLSASYAFAQDRHKFGINAGLTYSNFRGMNIPTFQFEYGFGFLVGVSYEQYLNDKLSIKANLSYDKKANKATSEIEYRGSVFEEPAVVTQELSFQYDYVTLPILMKYDFTNESSFFVNGGPFVGYLLSSRIVDNTSTNNLYPDTQSSTTTNYNNRLDYGLTLGFGKAFRINDENSIVVEIRNNIGFAKTNKDDTYQGDSVQTNSFNLLVGWAFDL